MCLKPKVSEVTHRYELLRQQEIYNMFDPKPRQLQYIKPANISKTVALNGCKNCINVVSKKLDVKAKDLCQNCRRLYC